MCELGEEEEEEEEREQSLSVPASPTLTRRAVPPRRIRLRSQSFDDIISGVNNDDSLSPPSFTTGDLSTTTTDDLSTTTTGDLSTTTTGDLPAVHVSARNFVFETTPPLDSGSDSGTEPLPRHGLGVAYDHAQLVSSQPEMTSAEPSSSSSWRGGGRLNQLRGKFLGRVRRGQSQQKTLSQEVPLQPMRPRSHHVTSDCGPDTGGREDTPAAVENTITTAPIPSSSQQQPQQQGSLVANRLLAVGQRFRNAPPTLLRRMGVVGGGNGQHHMIQAPPPDSQLSNIISNSGEDIQRKSKSNFISL